MKYDIHLMSTLKSARDDHLVRLIESLRANMAYLQWKKSIPGNAKKIEKIILRVIRLNNKILN